MIRTFLGNDNGFVLTERSTQTQNVAASSDRKPHSYSKVNGRNANENISPSLGFCDVMKTAKEVIAKPCLRKFMKSKSGLVLRFLRTVIQHYVWICMATSISEIEDVADNPREKATEQSVRELADIGKPSFLLHLELSSSKLPNVKPAAGLAGRTIGNIAIGLFGKMNTGLDQKLSSTTCRAFE